MVQEGARERFSGEALFKLRSEGELKLVSGIIHGGKTRQQPQCPLMNDWMKKMWDVYTREYYSAGRKDNELLPFVTTRMDPERAMLSEMSQTEKSKNHLASLICGI